MAVALAVVPGELAIARLEPGTPLPGWAEPDGELHAVVRGATDVTVVCPAARVPADARAERGWRALRVAGPPDFALTGVPPAGGGAPPRAGGPGFAGFAV